LLLSTVGEKLHVEKPHDLHLSSSNIRAIKLRKRRLERHVKSMMETRHR
jgi:hypothetical protein